MDRIPDRLDITVFLFRNDLFLRNKQMKHSSRQNGIELIRQIRPLDEAVLLKGVAVHGRRAGTSSSLQSLRTQIIV